MTVYVDESVHPFGNMMMCHCWADTLEELLAMMDAIGVQRKWIQGHPDMSSEKAKRASWVHFDIAKSKRARAVLLGAVETDRFGPLEHIGRLLIATGTERGIELGNKKLAMVAEARAR